MSTFSRQYDNSCTSPNVPKCPHYSSDRGTVGLSNDQILDLIKKYSGTGQKLSENRERIDFGIKIGKYVSEKSGKAYDTTVATVRYSKYGVHIVPARPRGWKGE